MDGIFDRIKFNAEGLVPAIAQSASTYQVLMMAWMNREAIDLTITTKTATYFSRSRNEIWVKGATSGNTQSVVEMRLDCDGDTVLLLVNEAGPACHTGTDTCFDADLIAEFHS
ncbi:MAG: phosphoribosyl-AMP cyclohydrolase [Actinomycetota bacterium]|jgi:phosphoribosyl-AMP cyclohydrolase